MAAATGELAPVSDATTTQAGGDLEAVEQEPTARTQRYIRVRVV